MDNATRLREYVDSVFATLPRTQRAVEVKQGILENMQEHYDALLAQGKNPDEALGAAISRFGSIDELRQELGDEPAAPPPPNLADSALREEYFGFMRKFSVMAAAAIGLFILAPMMFVLVENYSETLSMVVFFSLIATGVIVLVYGGTRKESYQRRLGLDSKDRPLSQAPYAAAQTSAFAPEPPREQSDELLTGGIYLLATIVFLTIGFTRGLWHPGWMVFLVATAIVMMIQGVRSR